MSERCQAKVFERSGQIRGWGNHRPCSRAAVRDGYCAAHHPDAEKARRERADARHASRIAYDRREAAIRAAEREVINTVLAADRAGHQWNDRGVAEAAGVLRHALEHKP